MPRIEEIDVIRRLTEPLIGPDVFDGKRVFDLPVGSEGTVVAVFHDGKAFEVEFLVFPDPAAPEDFRSVQIPVKADQCELAWKAPA